MKQYTKPDVMQCGCWNCSACAGTGINQEKHGPDKDKPCHACIGTGKVKLCKFHAQKDGWTK